MMHRAWSSIVEVPYSFSRSYVQFQGHTALKIVEFDPNWAFPDSNSSLNSPMAMKCCTKLETAKERCPIVFQGHPSNFKVTRDKTSPILTQIWRLRTIGQSQLWNPSDLPCFFNCLFRRRSEKTLKLHVTGLSEGNSPVTVDLNDVIMSSMHAGRSITFVWRFISNNYHAEKCYHLHRSISSSASRLKKSVQLSIYLSSIILSRIISHIPVKTPLFPGTCFDICI